MKTPIKQLKYSYQRADGQSEGENSEFSRGEKFSEVFAFFDFLDITGYINKKKKHLEYLLKFLIQNSMQKHEEEFC